MLGALRTHRSAVTHPNLGDVKRNTGSFSAQHQFYIAQIKQTYQAKLKP